MSAYRYQPRHAAWLRTRTTSTTTAQGSAVAVLERDEPSARVAPSVESE